MKLVRYISFILVSAFISGLAAMVLSYSPTDSEEQELLIGLSFICEQPPSSLLLSYADGDGNQRHSQIHSVHTSFNYTVNQIPYQDQFDSLVFTITSKEPIHITGLSFTTGNYFNTLRPNDILRWFEIKEDHIIDPMNQLVIVPDDSGEARLKLNQILRFSDAILKSEPEQRFLVPLPLYNLCWELRMKDYSKRRFLAVFILMFLVQCILLMVNWQRFGQAQFLAFVMAMIAGLIMYTLKEDVKNAHLKLEARSAVHPDHIEIFGYYSKNGSMEQDAVLKGEKEGEESIILQLPNGKFNQFRIDLPLSDTITIPYISLVLGPFEKVFTGYELIDAFPLLNDLNYRVTENGSLAFKTGVTDPYLSFGSSKLLRSLITLQVVFERFYTFFTAILFLVFLFVFSWFGADRKAIYLTLLITLLILPSLVFLGKKDGQVLETEKRDARQWPTEWNSAKDLAFKINGYLDDQFGGRSWLITKWNVINYYLFGQADNSAAVVFGKDNWMFYQGDGVGDLIENKVPLTLEEMQSMANVLEQRKAWLSSYGIEYYVVLPPLKFSIYGEMLPDHFKKRNPMSRRDQFAQYLVDNTQVKHIEVKDVLLAAKQEEKDRIYFKYDTHWNMTGALHAYRKIIQELSKDYSAIGKPWGKENFDWELVGSKEGDLAKLISLNDQLIREELMPYPKEGYVASVVSSRVYEQTETVKSTVTYEQPDTSLPSLLIDHDSFSNYLIPFLSQHFHRSVYSFSPLFSAEIIKQEMPDVVITEMTERSFSAIMLGNEDLLINELEAIDSSHSHTEILSGQR